MQNKKRNYLTLLFSFLLILFGSANAQSIVGKVISKKTGKDLGRVEVTLITSDERRETQSSQSDGIFKFYDAEISDSLLFKLENYEPLKVKINHTKIIVRMDTLIQSEQFVDPFAQTLSSAGKTDRSIGDIPASVVLITKDEIQSLGYQSVEEILINVPGLYGIEQHDWTGQGMNIGARGFYSPGFNNEMVILVNGVNMLEDHMSSYPLARLEVPIESIERIEVIRGPMSVIYGSGAFLGSINIITDVKNDDDTYKVSGIVSVGKGIQRDFRTTAVIEANTSLGHQSFSFGRSNFAGPSMEYRDIADDYLNDTASLAWNSNLFPDTIYPFDSIIYPNINTANNFNTERTFLNYSGNFGKFRMNLSYSQAFKGYNTNGASAMHLKNNGQLSGGNAQLSYLNQFLKDSILVFQAKIGYFSHRNIQDYSNTTTASFSGFHSNAIEAEVNGIWLLERSKLKWPVEITTGVYYRRAFGLYSFYGIDDGYSLDGTKENYGVLMNSFFDITPRRRKAGNTHQLQLVAGVRMEYIPKYDIRFAKSDNINTFDAPPIVIPRTGLIYKFNEKNIFKLLYGQGIKQPSFINSSENPALTPSKLGSFEINYLKTILPREAQGNRKKWRNDINVSLFYNNLTGLVERFSLFNSATGLYDYISLNQGEVETFGVELTNTLQFNQNLRLNASYTFQKSNNFTTYVASVDGTQGVLENVQYSPSSLAYANLIWKISDYFELGSKIRYVGSMFSEFILDLDDVTNEPQGYNGNIRKSPGYFICDVQLSIVQLLNQRLRIDLNGKNLLGTNFRIPFQQNNAWANRGMTGRGRWFMLTAKYLF